VAYLGFWKEEHILLQGHLFLVLSHPHPTSLGFSAFLKKESDQGICKAKLLWDHVSIGLVKSTTCCPPAILRSRSCNIRQQQQHISYHSHWRRKINKEADSWCQTHCTIYWHFERQNLTPHAALPEATTHYIEITTYSRYIFIINVYIYRSII